MVGFLNINFVNILKDCWRLKISENYKLKRNDMYYRDNLINIAVSDFPATLIICSIRHVIWIVACKQSKYLKVPAHKHQTRNILLPSTFIIHVGGYKENEDLVSETEKIATCMPVNLQGTWLCFYQFAHLAMVTWHFKVLTNESNWQSSI